VKKPVAPKTPDSSVNRSQPFPLEQAGGSDSKGARRGLFHFVRLFCKLRGWFGVTIFFFSFLFLKKEKKKKKKKRKQPNVSVADPVLPYYVWILLLLSLLLWERYRFIC